MWLEIAIWLNLGLFVMVRDAGAIAGQGGLTGTKGY